MLNFKDMLQRVPGIWERRTAEDRRERPTPFLSRYWLRGRRCAGRRDDERWNIYVDRYTRQEWALILGILALSLLDMAFTVLHLRAGGEEANPFMAWVLEQGGVRLFQIVKVVSSLVGLFVLLIHIRFKKVRFLLGAAFFLYAGVFLFHLYLVAVRL